MVTGAIAGQDLAALYGADPSGLSYASTMDKAVLHKHAVEAVMMTDSVQVSDDDYLVAGFLPRLYTPSCRAISNRFCRYDFATLFELARQAAFVVTHQHLDIPASWATLLFDVSLEIVDVGTSGPMAKPVKTVTKLHTERGYNKRGVLRACSFAMEVFAEDVLISRASAQGQVTKPEKYKLARDVGRDALLARNPPRSTAAVVPIDPALIGMKPGSSTVVGDLIEGSEPGRYTSRLSVDQDDLFYYDHPISHVSGIIGAEGLRQATLVAACTEHPELSPDETFVRRFQGTFSGFLEPDLDLDLDIMLGAPRAGESGTVVPAHAVLSQFGSELVAADCEIEFGSARGDALAVSGVPTIQTTTALE
jgi:hypothetical protein